MSGAEHKMARVPGEPGVAGGLTLASPTREVAGIGPRRAEALLELGIKTVGQLIAYLPVRHEKLEAEGRIADLVPDAMGAARGEVTATRIAGKGGRGAKKRFEAVLIDESGRLDLVWFHRAYLHGVIVPGVRLRVQGKVQRFGPSLQMVNPKHEVLAPEGSGAEPALRDERMRPVYGASAQITSEQIERAVQGAMAGVAGQIADHLPASFRRERQLVALEDAYRLIHAPGHAGEVAEARRRLAYDELLLLQMGLALKRAATRRTLRAPALAWNGAIDAHIRKRFGFALTGAQERVIAEIAADLQRTEPAGRLIQGDVGSGKTVVALYAMLMAVASRAQGVMMVPTELLAEQHCASVRRALLGTPVRVGLLTGSLGATEQARVRAGLADGTIDVCVGTHALLSEGVEFARLGVAVIDEQHKFGVHQRLALRSKGQKAEGGQVGGAGAPHVLVMTATPIPRTLAMTVLGDLDVSVIDQLPPGRKKVITRAVDSMMREEVYAFARQRIEAGEQAYIVAPAIDRQHEEEGALWERAEAEVGAEGVASEGPAISAAAREGPVTVTELAEQLRTGALAGKVVEVLHGRVPSEQRDAIMDRFRAGQVHALVATTVIEVGVDVPNATVMVVEDADRFGLATLHQLRGRVGRGGKGGVCVLIARAKTEQANARLHVMTSTSDGFELAQKDIEIRGFGDVIGVRQSGMPPFKVADLSKDLDLLTLARRDAAAWIAASPELARPDDALVRTRLLKAHGKWLGLADVG